MNRSAIITTGVLLASFATAAIQQVYGPEKYAEEWYVAMWTFGVPAAVLLGVGFVHWLRGDANVVEPDLDLDGFLDLWLGFDRRSVGNDMAKAEIVLTGTHDAFDAIAEAARNRAITVWGRKNSIVPGSIPRGPIPPEEWDYVSIDALEFLSGRDTREVRATTRFRLKGMNRFYSDLHVNLTEVRKRFPRITWWRTYQYMLRKRFKGSPHEHR